MSVRRHAFAHVALGLRIEGVPYLPAKRVDGAVFLYGDVPPWETTSGFLPSIVELPPAIRGKTNPWTSELDLSSLEVTLAASDAVLELLWSYPWPSGAVGELDAAGEFITAIGSADTSITITSGSTLAAGAYLWIGDECLFVDAASSADDVWTLTVTRAIAGSQARGHAPGTLVFTRCPMQHLEPICELVLYDFELEASVVLWRGLMRPDTQTDHDQNIVVVRADEMLQRLAALELNAVPSRFIGHDLRIRESGPRVAGRVEPIDDHRVNPAAGVVLRIGDFICPFADVDGTGFLVHTGASMFGTRVDGEPGDDVSGDIREVLAVSRLNTAESIAHNAFLGATNPLNFASIALALLLSTGDGDNNPSFGTFDVLGRRWGCGFPEILIDEESWLAAVALPLVVDQLLLGEDGPFTPWDTIRDLLSSSGHYLAITKDGRLAIRPFDATLTYADFVAMMEARHWTVIEPQTIQLQRGDVRPNVRAELGGIMADPNVITVAPIVGTRRDSSTFAQEPHAYRMPHRYRDADVHDFVTAQAVLRAENVPTIRVSVPYRHFSQQFDAGDYSPRVVPNLGEWIRLRRPVDSGLQVIGPDGERVDINATSILFVGILVGWTMHLTSGVCELEVLLTNWTSGDVLPRLVAPSHQIAFDEGEGELRLANTWKSAAGSHELAEGDQVRIVLDSGKTWPGSEESMIVDAVTELGVVLPELLDELPDHPLYVRLETVPPYDNDAWDTHGYAGAQASRRWAFVAGTDGTVDGDPADRYVP